MVEGDEQIEIEALEAHCIPPSGSDGGDPAAAAFYAIQRLNTYHSIIGFPESVRAL
jgi:hypothetical protein